MIVLIFLVVIAKDNKSGYERILSKLNELLKILCGEDFSKEIEGVENIHIKIEGCLHLRLLEEFCIGRSKICSIRCIHAIWGDSL